MVYLRKGIGVQLKDIKVFNRARQQGRTTVGMCKMYFRRQLIRNLCIFLFEMKYV